MKQCIVLLLLVACLFAFPGPVLAQGGGGDEEAPGWLDGLFGPIFQFFTNMWTDFKNRVVDLICHARAMYFTAIGRWVCVECGMEENEEGMGPGATWGCRSVDDCDCTLCPDWLSEYKHYIVDAVGWIMGGGNVFSQFIPWDFWSTCFSSYMIAAAIIWTMRLIARMGQFMFGRLTGN